MRIRWFQQRPCGFRWFFTLLLPLLFSATARGQGTVADYERARGLRATTANTVLLSDVKPHWFDQSKRFWYRNDLPNDQRSFFLVDVETGTRRTAFDHAALGKAIAEATKKAVDPLALPLTRLEFTAAAKVITFTAFDERPNDMLGWTLRGSVSLAARRVAKVPHALS